MPSTGLALAMSEKLNLPTCVRGEGGGGGKEKRGEEKEEKKKEKKDVKK